MRRVLSKKETLRRLYQTTYQAGSWSKSRKIIARAEATSIGTDVRFVVTNLPGTAKVLYEKIYCARGRMENMIKEHEALRALGPHLLPSLGGQSVPSPPVYGRLLAPALAEKDCPQALAMAHGDLRKPSAARSSKSRCVWIGMQI